MGSFIKHQVPNLQQETQSEPMTPETARLSLASLGLSPHQLPAPSSSCYVCMGRVGG